MTLTSHRPSSLSKQPNSLPAWQNGIQNIVAKVRRGAIFDSGRNSGVAAEGGSYICSALLFGRQAPGRTSVPVRFYGTRRPLLQEGERSSKAQPCNLLYTSTSNRMAELEPVGHQLVIVTLVFGIAALATLSVRLGFRLRSRKYDVSDTCLVAAMICGIVQSVIQIVLVAVFDYGKAKADIPVHLRTSTWPAILAYINQIVFKLTTPLCKLSLCFLYRSMCSTSTDRIIRITRLVIRATICLIIGAYSSAFLISIFQCTPVSKTWDKKVNGTCINMVAFRMSTAVFNLVTSVLVIAIPIPTLVKLKKHRPEVKQLLGLILLGLVHTGMTITRFVIMFYPDSLTKTEPQYTHIFNNVLAVVEMHTGILVATLVVMRPAFQAILKTVNPSYRPYGDPSYYGKQSSRGARSSYKMESFREKSKRKDQFSILETTEIHILEDVAKPGVGGQAYRGRDFQTQIQGKRSPEI
ncbi:hypothetical protein OPT61_g6996 [Boeremia exigua]|uniref:Uncharacterized protein n=1 Tax=Boeremia exigua TaxID=749465 RepID=A0ACC2I5K7_9PLEO|nr:hypothetical protein OPT61_g6996 [Boeremia exigua]